LYYTFLKIVLEFEIEMEFSIYKSLSSMVTLVNTWKVNQ